jgi:ABC-type sugar transport system permease subunit
MSAYWKANQRRLAPWMFLAPGMAMFLIYVIIPIFQSMWISFYDWDGLGEATWIGTANYAEMTTTRTWSPRSATTSCGLRSTCWRCRRGC